MKKKTKPRFLLELIVSDKKFSAVGDSLLSAVDNLFTQKLPPLKTFGRISINNQLVPIKLNILLMNNLRLKDWYRMVFAKRLETLR